VEARSDGSGKGTCFTVWLPLDNRQEERKPTTISGETMGLDGVRILLVDDSEDAMDAFSQLLEFCGAVIHTTTSPHDALTLLDAEQFDLLISDIGMPEMDGLTFIKAVREKEHGRALPAIAVTGFGRKGDIDRALAAGFNSHINKPVEIETVERVACKLLDRNSRE
jgi:two-component system CheB/CheR fusion protein